MTDKERNTYRRFVKLLTENFTKDELENIYVDEAESRAAIAQAIMSRKLMDKFEHEGKFENGHIRCSVCGECVTCNLRPCRNGKEHVPC